jgi:adenylate kinase
MSWTAASSDSQEVANPTAEGPRRFVLVGPPGAGKSSQGMRLASRIRVGHLSTGHLLREEVRRASPLGMRAREYMGTGGLVPDWLVLSVVECHLGNAIENGFVLDGYPRTLEQGKRFVRSLGRAKVDRVIELAVPDEVAVSRLTSRAVCDHCGTTGIDRSSSRCDRCDGEMKRRADDEEHVVRARLATYWSQTGPMLDFFRDEGLLTTIDGDRPPDVVTADLFERAAWCS